MRFLSVNHLRLGRTPAGIPTHVTADSRAFSTRTAWSRAVSTAKNLNVHAVVLSGETLAAENTSLEPWGPLVDGLADLQQAEIPVIALPSGEFHAELLSRFFKSTHVYWLKDALDWQPLFTTSTENLVAPSVHIVSGSLAEHGDAPAENPITLEEIDHPESMWILTDPVLPDSFEGNHALVIEAGATAPLKSHESGRMGAWLIDTDARTAELVPLASLEFAAIDIDISSANNLDELEQAVASGLVRSADQALADNSVVSTLLIDVTVSGRSRLYPALADTLAELEQMMVIEHKGVTIAITHATVAATPDIDLEPLLGRPDPVGELSRLIHALSSGDDLTDSQSRLLTATEQKLLSVSHARVFGSILDDPPETDAPTLLLKQGWATLDALVRQRGID